MTVSKDESALVGQRMLGGLSMTSKESMAVQVSIVITNDLSSSLTLLALTMGTKMPRVGDLHCFFQAARNPSELGQSGTGRAKNSCRRIEPGRGEPRIAAGAACPRKPHPRH